MKTIDLFSINSLDGLCNDMKATVNVYPVSDYLSWIELEMKPQEDMSIQLQDGKNVHLHFMYNLKDKISLKSLNTTEQKKLSKFQSAIMHDKRGRDTFLNLKANGHYHVCIIQLSKYNRTQKVNELFSQIEMVFKAMATKHYFIHTGLPNLQLGEYVRKLMDLPKIKVSDKMMAAGYINILLSIKLKQYLEYVHNPLPSSILSPCEIERIKKVSSAIQESPEMNYAIEELCKSTGMSAAKLQMGFKEMHGKTVCNFISNVRLEKAEELLKTTDLNVSQIVYSLGWTSRSYFCKIFKEKYQCSPKLYQTLVVEAS